MFIVTECENNGRLDAEERMVTLLEPEGKGFSYGTSNIQSKLLTKVGNESPGNNQLVAS